MSARRILRTASRPLRRLARRVFWRHHWESTGYSRRCTVCQRVDTLATDGWGGSWYRIVKGQKQRHWSGS